MHILLEQTLAKLGIKSVDELDANEKPVFDRYAKILATEEIGTPQIAEFCKMQKALIEGKFDIDNSPEKAKNLELLFTVYAKILNIIEGPRAERESLIRTLEKQLDAPTN